MRNKSLVIKSAIVVTVLLAVMTTVLSTFAYMKASEIYNNELMNIHKSLIRQVQIEADGIAGAAEKLSKLDKDNYVKDENIQWIHENLDKMVRDNFIVHSYLLFPEATEQNGKTFLRLLESDSSFQEAGVQSGELYELPPELAQAFKSLNSEETVISGVYDDLGGTWMSVMAPIRTDEQNIAAIFVVDFNHLLIQSDLNAILWKTIGVGTITGVLFIALIVLLVYKMMKPVKDLVQISVRAAGGDLTVSAPVKSKDEIGVLSESFNTMIRDIRNVVFNVKEAAAQVSESTEHLTQISEQTTLSAQTISGKMQEVAAGSDTQLQSAEESKGAMGEMAVGIQRIAQSSSLVAELSHEAASEANTGLETVKKAISKMEQVRTSVGESNDMARELAEHSRQISDIVGIIGNIANQTNLLALNASIESARAGEHGRGFAVVAQEVRKLAEQTKTSTEQIANMLQEVTARTGRLAEVMQKSEGEAESGANVVQTAGTSFEKLWQAVKEVTEQIQEVSASSEQMSAGSEEVLASLDNLAEIARGAAESSQNVSASSQEQLGIVEEIADSASMLQKKMMELEKEMAKFIL